MRHEEGSSNPSEARRSRSFGQIAAGFDCSATRPRFELCTGFVAVRIRFEFVFLVFWARV